MASIEIESLGKAVDRQEKYRTLVNLRCEQIEELSSEFESSNSIIENNSRGIHLRKVRKALERNKGKVESISEKIGDSSRLVESSLGIAGDLEREGNYPSRLLEEDRTAYKLILEKIRAYSPSTEEDDTAESLVEIDKKSEKKMEEVFTEETEEAEVEVEKEIEEIKDKVLEDEESDIKAEEPVNEEIMEEVVSDDRGKRRYRKEAAVDYSEKKKYIMPNGEIEELTEHRFITLTLLENGVMKRDDLAKRLYPDTYNKNKAEARGRVSALISSFSKYLYEKHNLQIVRITTRDEIRNGSDIEYWLQYFGDLEDVVSIEQPQAFQLPAFPELRHIESANMHKYDKSITISSHLERIQATEEDERTPEDIQLIEDIEFLSILSNFNGYKNVYRPQEIRILVERIRKVASKNIDDLREVESKIKDHLCYLDNKDADYYDVSMRSEMSLEWIQKKAKRINAYIIAKYRNRPEQSRYFIKLVDPTAGKRKGPDMTAIYQFLANDHAIDSIGKRDNEASVLRHGAFIENCEAINAWYDEAKPLIDKIPDYLKLTTTIRGHERLASAKWVLEQMIESMHTRLNGNVFTGFDKKFTYDIPGALNLQKRIKYSVDEINVLLAQPPIPQSEEMIVPLDPES